MSDSCFHCGSDVPQNLQLNVEILGEARAMCCVGCQAVANAIIASGSEQFYQFRTDLSETPEFTPQSLPESVQNELSLYDNSDVLDDITSTDAAGMRTMTLVVEGITCAACSWLIEKQLSAMNGVHKASLNLSQHRLNIEWQQDDTPLSSIIQRIYALGFKAHPYSPDQAQIQLEQEQKLAMRRLALAALATMQAMMFAVPLYVGDWSGILLKYETYFRFAGLAITTPVVLYSARPFFVAFLRDLKTRHLTMDVPVAIAIGGAYTASVWSTFTQGEEVYYDSVCMFTFFLLLGRFLEMRARLRTGEAGNHLASLMPPSAIRLTQDENKHWQETVIPAKQLKVGDRVLVKPGTQIPADGHVVSGQSGVDESAITGEFVPVHKTQGQPVIGGTVNVESPIEVEVSATGQDMQVSTIVKLLDRAQEEKPAIALLADHIAQYFVAAVLCISALTFGIWYVVDSERAFWIMLSVLVVTCPCALSLATPTALTAATGALRRQGTLITRGHVLEGLSKSRRIVFDKTGTLTTGQLSIESIQPISGEQSTALQIASALEQHSQHPIAHAFSEHGELKAKNVQATPGKGVSGEIDGTLYYIGQAIFAYPASVLTPPSSGHWILLASSEQPIAWFKLNDQLRSDAGNTIQQLHKLKFKTELLSGDASDQVAYYAEQLNINTYQSGVSPEGKLSHIKSLPKNDHSIMVGDGINDVPVLAQAPVSIAVGSASDLAKTHADVILVSNQLKRLPQLIKHGLKTRRIIQQNLTWALMYNASALPLAAMGMVPPYAAAIGMSLSSLVVVGNALRLNKVAN